MSLKVLSCRSEGPRRTALCPLVQNWTGVWSDVQEAQSVSTCRPDSGGVASSSPAATIGLARIAAPWPLISYGDARPPPAQLLGDADTTVTCRRGTKEFYDPVYCPRTPSSVPASQWGFLQAPGWPWPSDRPMVARSISHIPVFLITFQIPAHVSLFPIFVHVFIGRLKS